jgi:hypothetical protein
VADVLKAALVSTQAALNSLASSTASAAAAATDTSAGGAQTGAGGAAVAASAAALATTGASLQRGLQQQAPQEPPEVMAVMGQTLVLHLPPAFIAALGGPQAAARAAAAAVQGGLQGLYVGRAQLAAPLGASFTAGRTLHPLELLPVAAEG